MSEPLRIPVSSIWAGLKEYVSHPTGCSCEECVFLRKHLDEWEEKLKPLLADDSDRIAASDLTIVINTRA